MGMGKEEMLLEKLGSAVVYWRGSLILRSCSRSSLCPGKSGKSMIVAFSLLINNVDDILPHKF
jgi:hypothetical protein